LFNTNHNKEIHAPIGVEFAYMLPVHLIEIQNHKLPIITEPEFSYAYEKKRMEIGDTLPYF